MSDSEQIIEEVAALVEVVEVQRVKLFAVASLHRGDKYHTLESYAVLLELARDALRAESGPNGNPIVRQGLYEATKALLRPVDAVIDAFTPRVPS